MEENESVSAFISRIKYLKDKMGDIRESIPSFCKYPFATNLALYLSRLPSTLNMGLYNHLYAMGPFPLGNSVNS